MHVKKDWKVIECTTNIKICRQITVEIITRNHIIISIRWARLKQWNYLQIVIIRGEHLIKYNHVPKKSSEKIKNYTNM